MAICTPFTPCAICGLPLGDETGVIGFPDLLPMFDEFGEFYDAAAHGQCLMTWNRRDEFVAYFNAHAAARKVDHIWSLVVERDGAVTFARPK